MRVISDLTAEETVGTFYEKNVKKNKWKRVWSLKGNKQKSW